MVTPDWMKKIIVDTYGGAVCHGGGFFRKGPSKVDRSAAYAARYLAKMLEAAKLAEIDVAYNSHMPLEYLNLSVYVDCHGTGKQDGEKYQYLI